MEKYKPIMSFGEDTAKGYNPQRGDERETVACLEQLAQGGPALELAIGAGRIALPLAATYSYSAEGKAPRFCYYLPMFDSVGNHSKSQGLGFGNRFFPSLSVGQYSWKVLHFRYPAPVFFPVKLDK